MVRTITNYFFFFNGVMSKFCFHLKSWEQIDGFWWNFVYAVLWLAHEIFLNISTELWPLIDVKISSFRNNEWILIKFCLCINIYDPCCDKYTLFLWTFQQLWPLIDFRIMFMFNIFWNNWWIWSNLVVTCTLIFFYAKTCNNKNKHSGGVSCSACNAFIIIFCCHSAFYIFYFWGKIVLTKLLKNL